MSARLARTADGWWLVTPAGLVRSASPHKPALAADAAACAVAEALADAGLKAGHQITAAHENGQLVVSVSGADPGRVRDAVAGFTLTVRTRPQRSDLRAKGTRP